MVNNGRKGQKFRDLDMIEFLFYVRPGSLAGI